MFRVKICGIQTPEAAQAVASAGADAIGLNFYAPSPRSLTVEQAVGLAQSLPPGLVKVGLFVNATAQQVLQTSAAVGLDAVQLHGDETPEFLAEVAELKCIIKAFRLATPDLKPVCDFLQSCQVLGRLPDMVLVDAYHPNAYGGTGHRLDWQGLSNWQETLAEPGVASDAGGRIPLILAGGLTATNVAEAISVVQPSGVDTASGVESSPAVKDPVLIKVFAEQALKAFAGREQQG